MQKCQNYINGHWMDSSSGEVIEVNDPATGKIPNNIRKKELTFAKTLPKATSFSKNNW